MDATNIRKQLAKIQAAIDLIARSLPGPDTENLTLQVPAGYRLSKREARRRTYLRKPFWKPDYVRISVT